MNKIGFLASVFFILSIIFLDNAYAENVPLCVKNTAKWYGEGLISETDFINAIKFLIENNIIVLDFEKVALPAEESLEPSVAVVIIPNGNAKQSNTGFYVPLNLEIRKGTIAQWINEDNFSHTISSQNEFGKAISLFNSPVLKTGETFSHAFEELGVYNYFCTLHPWRIGVVTVR